MNKVLNLLTEFNKLTNEEKEAFLKVVNLSSPEHIHVKVGDDDSEKSTQVHSDFIKKLIEESKKVSTPPYVKPYSPFGLPQTFLGEIGEPINLEPNCTKYVKGVTRFE